MRPFVGLLAILLLASISLAGVAIWGDSRGGLPALVRVGYPLVSWGGALALSVLALLLRRRGRMRLPTAALLVQSLGVFTLLLGLSIGVAPVLRRLLRGYGDVYDLAPFFWPLIEGFVAAGVSTLLAALLRVCEDVFAPMRAAGAPPVPSMWAGGASLGVLPELGERMGRLKDDLTRASGEAKTLASNLAHANEVLVQVGILLETFDKFFARPDPREGGDDRARE